jgi:hypothetical protein
VEGCLVVGRFTMRTHTPPEIAEALARGSRWPQVSQWIGWNAKKVAKVVGGPLYLEARRALLQ